MNDEEVQSIGLDKNNDTSWVWDIFNLSDEDLIRKFAGGEILPEESLSYYCLTSGGKHCHCMRDLELLVKQPDEGLYQSIRQYEVNHQIGCCQHVWRIIDGSEILEENESIISQNVHYDKFPDAEEIRNNRLTFEEAIRKCGTHDRSRVHLITTEESSQIPAIGIKKVAFYATTSISPILNVLTAAGRKDVIEGLTYDSSINLGFLKMQMGTYQKSKNLGLMPVHIAIEHEHFELLKFYLDLLGDGYFHLLETSNIGKITYLFALKRDNMKVFHLLLKKYKKLRSRIEYQKILSSSLAFSFANGKDLGILKNLTRKGATLENVPLWVHNLTPFTSIMVREVLEKVITATDVEVFRLALHSKLPDYDIGYTVDRIVYHDRENFLRILIRGRPKEVSSIMTCDHLTQAVINNSPKVLGQFLELCIPRKFLKEKKLKHVQHFQHNHCMSTNISIQDLRYVAHFSSLLDSWACGDLLIQKLSLISGLNLDSPTEYSRSPLNEIFRFECKFSSRSKLIQTMVEKDEIVNSNHGYTPLEEALRVKDHQSIQTLLYAGADPFPVHALSSLSSEMYLIDLIQCNVNLTDKLEVLCSFKESFQRTIANCLFVLASISCISAADRTFLNSFTRELEQMRKGVDNHTSEFETLMRVIDIVLNEPLTLQLSCRNVLRKTFLRTEICRLVNSTPIPRKLKRFVLLEDALEEFRATLEPVRILANLDSYISKFSDYPSQIH